MRGITKFIYNKDVFVSSVDSLPALHLFSSAQSGHCVEQSLHLGSGNESVPGRFSTEIFWSLNSPQYCNRYSNNFVYIHTYVKI